MFGANSCGQAHSSGPGDGMPTWVRRKVAESMPAAQHPSPGKQIGSSRHAQAGKHGGFPPPYMEATQYVAWQI